MESRIANQVKPSALWSVPLGRFCMAYVVALVGASACSDAVESHGLDVGAAGTAAPEYQAVAQQSTLPVAGATAVAATATENDENADVAVDVIDHGSSESPPIDEISVVPHSASVGGVSSKSWGSSKKCTSKMRYGKITLVYKIKSVEFARSSLDYNTCNDAKKRVAFVHQTLAASGSTVLGASWTGGSFFRNNEYDLQYKVNLKLEIGKLPIVDRGVGHRTFTLQIGYSGRYSYTHVCYNDLCKKG